MHRQNRVWINPGPGVQTCPNEPGRTIVRYDHMTGDLRKSRKQEVHVLPYSVSVSEWYPSLTAHQHQKGHTVPKPVIMIATSIQFATVWELHCVRAFAIRPSLNKMSNKTWYPGAPRVGCSHAPLLSIRIYSKVCNMWRQFPPRHWPEKDQDQPPTEADLICSTGEPGLSSQLLSPQSNPGASPGW